MNRQELSKSIIKSFNNNNNLILEFATGVGKTKISLDCVLGNKIINPKTLIVVSERAHIKGWLEEIHKWNYSTENIFILCYASLKKIINNKYDTIICDEIHNLSAERIKHLKKILSNNFNTRFIGLSATITWDLKYVLRSFINNLKFMKYELKEAIKNNILPTPEIILVPLTLSPTLMDKIEVRKGKGGEEVCLNGFNSLQKYISKEKNKNIKDKPTLIVEDSVKNIYNYIDQRVTTYSELSKKGRTSPLLSLREGLKRKNFLGKTKTSYVKKLINSFGEDERIIAFTTNIEQCNELGENKYALHSKSKNKDILSDFNNHKINRIFTVKMLREGTNLVNTPIGIITQLDGTTGMFIQKLGRLLRHESPKIFIFYYKNTSDENYLNKAMEEVDNKYVKEITLENYIKKKQ